MNRAPTRRLTALYLTTMLVVSALAATVFVGPAAAAANASVGVENTANGETTGYDWTAPVGSSGTVKEVRLNYTGSGSDASLAGVQNSR